MHHVTSTWFRDAEISGMVATFTAHELLCTYMPCHSAEEICSLKNLTRPLKCAERDRVDLPWLEKLLPDLASFRDADSYDRDSAGSSVSRY